VPKAIASEVSRLTDLLRVPLGSAYKWTPAENLHLTLLFLGRVGEDQVAELQARLSSVTESPMMLEQGPVVGFPSAVKPRVVALEIGDPGGGLHRLQSAIEAQAREYVDKPDRRPFRAHVTFGRLRRNARPVPLPKKLITRPFQWRTGRYHLMESRLGGENSRYEVLSEYKLDDA
jgi:2'-5' RNA ligase